MESEQNKCVEEKNNERWGSGDVYIEKVETLNIKREAKKIFNPFDDIIVRIHYKSSPAIKKAVYGVEIFDELNNQLFGYNTSFSEKSNEIKKEGHFDFILHEIPFANGRYFITPAIANEICTIQYDYWKNAAYIDVMNDDYKKFVFGKVNIKVDFNE